MSFDGLNLHAGIWTAVLRKNAVSVQLFGYLTNPGLEAKRGDCNAVVGGLFFGFFFFFYSEITQKPVNVLKSVSVCIKLSPK